MCPTCGREHDAAERFCDDCGMPLVHLGGEHDEPARDEAHERARKIRPEYTRGELVRVAGARHQAEAELIQNILLEEGVPSILRRTAGFDVPDYLAAGPRDVLVPEAGVEAAREVLLEAELIDEAGAAPLRSPVRLLAGLLIALALGALVVWAVSELVR